MAEAQQSKATKMIRYKGTSDVRVIDKNRWDKENNWEVPESDVPNEIKDMIKDGPLKSEFEVK